MKKLFYILLSVAIIAGAAGIFTACDNNQTANKQEPTETPSDTSGNTELAAPANLQWDTESWTLSWDAVEGAESYGIWAYEIGEYYYSTENFYCFEYELTTNSTAKLVVYSENSCTISDWSEEIECATEVSTAVLVYTLMDDGTGYEVDRRYSNLNAGLDGRVVIADMYNGLPVKSIAEYAFSYNGFGIDIETGAGCNTVTTSFHLPKYLESIGDNAFYACLALEEVYIPDGVTEIGEDAFASCINLKNINFPLGITEIPLAMLARTAITEITIPSHITAIGYRAFSACYNLTQVTLNDNITYIGSYAFINCSSLSEIIIPEAVTYIGYQAFYSCTSLSEITILENVEYVGGWAFYNCSSIETVNFLAHPEYLGDNVFYGTAWQNALTDDSIILNGDILYLYQGSDTQINNLSVGVKYVAGGAFYKNTDITSVDIFGITFIGDYIFFKCTSLVSVKLTDIAGNTEYAFYDCTSLKQVELCGNIQSIGESMFDGCSALESVTLPDSFEIVGYKAFYCCSTLKKIVIPDSVTKIEQWAFGNCTGLEEIYVGSGLTSVIKWAFHQCRALKVVYYNGTEEQWDKIEIDSLFNSAFTENVYFYSQTEPALNEDSTAYIGNYWHYDENNEMVVWTV